MKIDPMRVEVHPSWFQKGVGKYKVTWVPVLYLQLIIDTFSL